MMKLQKLLQRTGFILAIGCLFTISCNYTLKIKDGSTAYERKQFAVAIPMLAREQAKANTRKERGQLAYMLADAYRRTGNEAKAYEWFQVAYNNNYGLDALKQQAFSLKKLERYKEAREAFTQLGLEIGSRYEYRREITSCNIAEGWLNEMPDNGWTIEKAPFNSTDNDFAPVFYPDGRIVFTSDRSLSLGKENYTWTGHKFMDILIVEPNGASPQIFDNEINTKGNEGVPCFNSDATEMFFSRAVSAVKGEDALNKIYLVSRGNVPGPWSTPVPIPFQKDKVNYLHPCLSSDGSTLYFASDDSDGWGGFDLYSMKRSPNSETGWEEPQILGRNINTPGNELFPSFDADTLYFASNGIAGMGGLDIFRTFKSVRNAWAPPINLKAPINGGSDDFGFVVMPATNSGEAKAPGDLIKYGFFSSNRTVNGAFEGDNIYKFEQRVPPPKPPKVDTVESKPLEFKLILEGYVLEKILTDPTDPNSKVLGRKPLSGAAVQALFGVKKSNFKTGEDGMFRMELSENMDYDFVASLAGYLSNSAKFSTKGIARDPSNPVQTFEIEIVLDKIFRDREIVLENIYYDFDKWDIRADAAPTLNQLADVLKQNPDIKIELGSHTDCRGNNAYNQNLSQRRAQSAVNYLISRGIEPSRLSAIGYGESQPAAICACSRCTESEHQTNRRTTFKVLE